MVSAYGEVIRQVTPAIIRDVSSGIAPNATSERISGDPGLTSNAHGCGGQVESAPPPSSEVFASGHYKTALGEPTPPLSDDYAHPGGYAVSEDEGIHERAELLARSIEGSIGRGIAHLQRQESVAKSIEVLTAGGETLVARLERAIHRIEQLEATRVQRMIARDEGERRLDEKLERGQVLLATFSDTSRRIEETARLADDRLDAVQRDCQDRIATLEDRLCAWLEKTEQIDGRVDQLDRAFDRARDIEERLAGFGERLVHAGENTQEKIAVLMKGLTSGEEVLVQLESSAREAKAVAESCAESVKTHSTAVQSVEDRYETASKRLESNAEQAR
ncbi:MAG: hypothetical protein IID38_10120, partial [Planctomycetes bacterium]|nr:hypothetical protein [Planctomycetota bacterium]